MNPLFYISLFMVFVGGYIYLIGRIGQLEEKIDELLKLIKGDVIKEGRIGDEPFDMETLK